MPTSQTSTSPVSPDSSLLADVYWDLNAHRRAAGLRMWSALRIEYEDRSQRSPVSWDLGDPNVWEGSFVARVAHPQNNFVEAVPIILHVVFYHEPPLADLVQDVYAKSRSGAFIGNEVDQQTLDAERVEHERAHLRRTFNESTMESRNRDHGHHPDDGKIDGRRVVSRESRHNGDDDAYETVRPRRARL